MALSRSPVVLVGFFFFFVIAFGLFAQLRHQRGIDRANEIWRSTLVVPIVDLGETKHLSILPLVNWHAADDDLMTEPGVSYLVRTDQNTLLFDFGFNRNGESPSPLEHNMRRLGVSLDEIDRDFALLQSLDLGLVALGGHDTSDEVLVAIEKTFGAKSRRIQVDRWIEVSP